MKLSIFSDRRAAAQTALFALFAFFCAHAFCFFNLTYSGPSVMLNAANAASLQLEDGLFLQPVYFALRGGVASPLLTGLICALCLCAALPMTAELLGVSSLPLRLALCAVVCTHPALTALFAAQLHIADALCLSLPLVLAGLLFWRRHRLGFLPGAVLLAAAMGLSPYAASLAAGLALLALVAALADGASGRCAAGLILRAAAMALLAAALFAAGLFVLLRLAGLELSAALQMQDRLWDLWRYPLTQLFAPLTYYSAIHAPLRALLLLAALWAALRLPGARLSRRLTIIAALALLPLAVNLPVLSTEPSAQLRLAYVLPDAALLLLIGRARPLRLSCAPVRRFAAAALAVLSLGCAIFSNQVYLKKNLEFEATLSLMTRVLDRAEDTPGYQPGLTPLAIIGTPEDASAAAALNGFDHLTALDAAANTRAVTSTEEMTWYLWEILGCPANLISDYELEQLAQQDDVRAMPVYPAAGCCAFVGDVLVIRLAR